MIEIRGQWRYFNPTETDVGILIKYLNGEIPPYLTQYAEFYETLHLLIKVGY